MEILIFNCFTAVIGVVIAQRKNRNLPLWFFLCFFLSLIGLIVILLLPKVTAIDDESTSIEKGGTTTNNHAKKIAPVIIIAGFAVYYGLSLDKERQALVENTKTELIAQCNNESVCLKKIQTNYDSCANQFISIVKKSRRTRDVEIDREHLLACIVGDDNL